MEPVERRSGTRRVLVLGATGMAGHLIAEYLSESGHAVVRVARKATGQGGATVDVTNPAALAEVLALPALDVVVNCVGTLVAASEENKSAAIMTNSYLPHYLAETYARTDTRVIHLSTDCVFSGKAPPYPENALPDGRAFYDRTKALGEIVNDKDLTVRMSIIGPETREGGTGLLHWFLGQTGDVPGYEDAIWNGITTLELAKAIESFLEASPTGVYHLVPQEPISKYQLLKLAARSFGRPDLRVRPVRAGLIDKTLSDTRQSLNFALANGGYQKMLDDLRLWVVSHRELYGDIPRYARSFTALEAR